MDDMDPTTTNPKFYRTLWENDNVRVLEYLDAPGQETTPHEHPNTVMVTLSAFDRNLSTPAGSRDLSLPFGAAVWLPAQTHSGRNTAETPTHTILVELKTSAVSDQSASALGPDLRKV